MPDWDAPVQCVAASSSSCGLDWLPLRCGNDQDSVSGKVGDHPHGIARRRKRVGAGELLQNGAVVSVHVATAVDAAVGGSGTGGPVATGAAAVQAAQTPIN